MNILIVNDDGPKALGLRILRDAVKLRWPHARQVVMVPVKPMTGQGMSVTAVREIGKLKREQVEPDFWVVEGKPADLIYLATYHYNEFISTGTWDLLLSGVNHGQNVGLDVYHSGTVGMAMLASSGFGIPSIAFSQTMEATEPDGSAQEANRFVNTTPLILNILASFTPAFGECFNVNFPAGEPKGWRTCTVAPFSRWRTPPPSSMMKGPLLDYYELAAGYLTISEIALRCNPTIRF